MIAEYLRAHYFGKKCREHLTKNKRGPKNEPCGTPEVTRSKMEKVSICDYY